MKHSELEPVSIEALPSAKRLRRKESQRQIVFATHHHTFLFSLRIHLFPVLIHLTLQVDDGAGRQMVREVDSPHTLVTQGCDNRIT